MKREEIAGLQVALTGGDDGDGAGAGPLVVLLHGFGAPGDDLVPLARALRAPAGTRFAFPVGPVALPSPLPVLPPGRAWWMIDVAALEEAIASGRERDLSGSAPDGLAEARARLDGCLDGLVERLAPPRLVLGGFSQGAMLACDAALRSERALDGLALLSGTLLAEAEWRAGAAGRAGLPVFQSHGRRDPLLPFRQAERLRDLLGAAGLPVTWVPFDGAHEIPPVVLNGLQRFASHALAPP